MTRFVKINDMHVNANFITSYRQNENGSYIVFFKGGDCTTTNDDSFIQDLDTGSQLIQVIPCMKPMYAVYEQEKGSGTTEDINYLGLFADGEIKGLTWINGYFNIVNDADNFIGLYFREE